MPYYYLDIFKLLGGELLKNYHHFSNFLIVSIKFETTISNNVSHVVIIGMCNN